MDVKQQRQQTQTRQRLFTASEVAEFEYCPLVWWHEQFEPLAQADNEELFARLVELEHEHGAQAPALPEYRMVEQLLLRRGAFEEGQRQHLDHAEDVEEMREEARRGVRATGRMRVITVIAVIMVCLALALIVASILLR
jgi:L-fucose isomerase-like protein